MMDRVMAVVMDHEVVMVKDHVAMVVVMDH